MVEPVSVGIVVAAVGKKVLGKTLDIIGDDVANVYLKGRDRIFEAAARKTKNIEEEGQTNIRVTKDVIFNGSFTDDQICAEYFGGILASSRSKDGRSDAGIFYADIIKGLSSAQLRTHYILYRTLNKELLASEEKHSLNPGQEDELQKEKLYIPITQVEIKHGEDLGAVLHGLASVKVIGNFQTNSQKLTGDRSLPYLYFVPTSLGVQLFSIANNMFAEWRNYASVDFEDFPDVVLPTVYGATLESMSERGGINTSDFLNENESNE